MLPRPISSLLLALAAALPAAPSHAAGALDPLYGSGGRVRTDFDGREERPLASLLLPDGRLQVLALRDRETGSLLARYAPDGTLEKTRFMPPGARGETLQPTALARQPDGRMLVAGTRLDRNGQQPRLFVLRFHADGTPDTGFGNGGRVDADLPTTATKLLVLDSGRIWMLGTVSVAPSAGTLRGVLLALNADGTPDAAVGPAGQVMLQDLAAVNDAIVQPEGVVIVGGTGLSGLDPVPPSLVIARLDPASGRFDTRFGNGGSVRLPGVHGEAFTSVVALPDGRLVAAGNMAGVLAGGIPNPVRLRRFSPDGALDATMAEPPLTLAQGVRLAQHQGTLWLAGTAGSGSGSNLGLWRLTEGGAIDATFGSAGLVSADFGAGELLTSLQVQADGKPLLVGMRVPASGNDLDIVLARVDPAAPAAGAVQPATSPSMRSTSKSRPRTEPSSAASRSLFQRSSGAPLTYQLLPLSARISP